MNMKLMQLGAKSIDLRAQMDPSHHVQTGKLGERKVTLERKPPDRVLKEPEVSHEVYKGLSSRRVKISSIGGLSKLDTGKHVNASGQRKIIYQKLNEYQQADKQIPMDRYRLLKSTEQKVNNYIKELQNETRPLSKEQKAELKEMKSLLIAVRQEKQMLQDADPMSGERDDAAKKRHSGQELTSREIDILAAPLNRSIIEDFITHKFSRDETVVLMKLGFRDARQAHEFLNTNKPTPGELRKMMPFALNHVKPDLALTAVRKGYPMEDAIYLSFSVEEKRLLKEAGMSFKVEGLLYRDANIPITSSTLVGHFKDQNLVTEKMQELGHGVFNTVYKGTFAIGERKVEMVFKPESSSGTGASVSTQSGIDPATPQYGLRNIATYQIAKLLNFDVIPKSEFGIHDGKIGIMMELAPGKPPTRNVKVVMNQEEFNLLKQDNNVEGRREFAEKNGIPFDPNLPMNGLTFTPASTHEGKYSVSGPKLVNDIPRTNPSLRRELVKLQLMDSLCAQGDRHSGNYLIQYQESSQSFKVTGIDNDLSFGKHFTDPNDVGRTQLRDYCRGAKLPPRIDSEMATAIKGLKEEDLRNCLQDLLTTDEIDSTVTRLQKMKAYVLEMELKNLILDPGNGENGWGMRTEEFDNLFIGGAFNSNSYASRDLL